jgi:hypothetical protein
VKRSPWRRIVGWILIVLGVLVTLTGLIGILGSGQPGVTDPAAAQTGGFAFIVLGLIVAAPGVYLVVRKARAASRAVPSPEQVESVKRPRWRRILGWVLTALGVLVALVGLSGILSSVQPGATDPAASRNARDVGVAFVVVGLGVAAAGIFLVFRKARTASLAELSVEQLEKQVRRDWRTALLVYASVSLITVVGGLFSYVYSQTFAADVQALESAVPCATHSGDPNCYQHRDVSITKVDVNHNRSGEIDTVNFLDAGVTHEVRIQPGNLDSSVLRGGAPAAATLWRGRYTNLKIAGIAFVTADNPVGQRDEFRAIALTGIVGGLLMSTAIPVVVLRHRRRGDDWTTAELRPGEFAPESNALPVSYPWLPLLIRPRPWLKRISPRTLLLMSGSLLGTYVAVAPYGSVPVWALISIDAAGIALFIAWNLLSSRNSGLFVDDMSFGAVDALGRRRAWPRTEASRIVRRWVLDGRARRMPFDTIFIVGADGHAKLRFATSLYSRSDILQYASALRLTLDESMLDTPITQAEFSR